MSSSARRVSTRHAAAGNSQRSPSPSQKLAPSSPSPPSSASLGLKAIAQMYMDALSQRPMLTKSVTCFVGECFSFFLCCSIDGGRRRRRVNERTRCALPFSLTFLLSLRLSLSLSVSLSLSLSLSQKPGGVLGDLLAQQTTGLPFDAARNLRLATFGLVFGGPAGHLWHRALDACFVAGGSAAGGGAKGRGGGFAALSASQPRVVLSKLACDQLLFAPVATALLFVFLKITEGGTPAEAAAFCAENWWRTLKVREREERVSLLLFLFSAVFFFVLTTWGKSSLFSFPSLSLSPPLSLSFS